jgi:hypothetical protein
MAEAMGDREAGLRLALMDYVSGINSPRGAIGLIAEMATECKNWQAMTLHAKNLLAKKRRPEALAVAMNLCRATEPGSPMEAKKTKDDRLPRPWETWVNAVDKSNQSELQLAWQYGAEVWDDPQACAQHAQSVKFKFGISYWLKHTTKGAMGGNVKAMQDLGRYYLAYHGWHPKKGRMIWRTPDSRIGFAWLEMAAEFAEPMDAANMWAGMAMVLREHGDRAGGMHYLQEGFKQIEGRDDVAFPIVIEEALLELRYLMEGWGIKDMVTAAEEKVTPSRFLGPPMVLDPG